MMDSYLSGRVQRVVLSGEPSNYLPITSGVPQGSILGPLLFTIYTSQFHKCLVYCQHHMYADDTQLYYSFHPSESIEAAHKINADLSKLLMVAGDHLLDINPSKSSVTLFGCEAHRNYVSGVLDIRINGHSLQFQNEVRNLGLMLDGGLKFKKHINVMLGRSYSALKAIYRHRKILSQDVKISLCESLVLSHSNFCDVVYTPFLGCEDKRRIQVLQNSCLRMIFGIRRRQRISHKLNDVKWLNMASRRQYHLGCFCFKILKYQTPPYLHKKLSFRTDIHNINIRRKNLLTIPKHKKETFKSSFTYNATCILNNCNRNELTLSYSAFKRGFKKCLYGKQMR